MRPITLYFGLGSNYHLLRVHLPNQPEFLEQQSYLADSLNQIPHLIMCQGGFSASPVLDMLAQRIVEILPILDGVVLSWTVAVLISVNSESVEDGEGWMLHILNLLEGVIEARVCGSSIESHEEGHGESLVCVDFDSAIERVLDGGMKLEGWLIIGTESG